MSGIGAPSGSSMIVFPIPMRGNEMNFESGPSPTLAQVPNPHEG